METGKWLLCASGLIGCFIIGTAIVIFLLFYELDGVFYNVRSN